MRLTKQTGHAIRILVHCAQAGGQRVKVADIAAGLAITPQNTFKIVHILVKFGFLKAVRGRAGGVMLARPAEAIVIGDVVRATEVTHVEVDEGGGTRAAEVQPMPINQILDEALGAFIAILDQHTLADMARTKPSAAAAPEPDPELERRSGTTRRRTLPASARGTGSARLPKQAP